MRSWLVALGVGFAASACLVEPEHVLACGDGYVDALAGEECDPNDRSSYIGACLDTSRPFGEGDCDPESCEIINTAVQCAYCGDGIIDAAAGEKCDGNNIGVPCKGGGQPTCNLDCTIDMGSCEACGNGVRDDGEECDPAEPTGGFVAPYPCAGNAELPPLDPVNPDKPFTSGTAAQCTNRCTFNRSSCGYCGDGVQDGTLPVSSTDGAQQSFPELCDGDAFDRDALANAYPACAEPGAQAYLACDADCLGVTC